MDNVTVTGVGRPVVRALAAAGLLAVIGSCAPEARQADLIFHNGRIVTVDPGIGDVAALAVRAGRVEAVGSDAEVLLLRGPDTHVVDLGGGTVVPGLTDNHFHALGGGPGVDLSGVRNMAELLAAIADRAAETEPGELVVTNSNWHEGQLAEQRLPLRDDLDRVAPDHLVVVVRGGHEFILNSAALSRWGIDEADESPPGGRIGRYDDGRLNGELVDRAKDPVTLPPRAAEDPAARFLETQAVMNALGVTALRIPGGTPEQFTMLRRRNTKGLNHREKSRKVLQGCTICALCRCTGRCWTVPPKREDRA